MTTFRCMYLAVFALLGHLSGSIQAQSSVHAVSTGALVPAPGSLPRLSVEPRLEMPAGYVLPSSVDLSPYFPPAGDQGRQYACTAWALCYGLLSYRKNMLAGRSYGKTGPADTAHTFSPAFMFNLMKTGTGTNCYDGLDFEDVASMSSIAGCCSLGQMPYDTSYDACTKAPTLETYFKSIPNHAPEAVLLDSYNIEQWKYHLAQGQPIIALIVIDSTFVYGGYATHGEKEFIWRFHKWKNGYGGHAVVCTGYDGDSTFTFLNSFGQQWGSHGYFKATYNVLEWKCYGGYVMSNDSVVDWPTDSSATAVPAPSSGPTVKGTLSPNVPQRINDMRAKLAGSMSEAVIQFVDATTDSVIKILRVAPRQRATFYHKGNSIDFMYHAPTEATPSGCVPYTMCTKPARKDKFIRKRAKTLRRLYHDVPASSRSTAR